MISGKRPSPRMADFLFWGGITMSLGWGLRGTIGGGPLGAMIPGAMIALLICLFTGRSGAAAAIAAAFGAIGIGFGGDMTYGQTVGLASNPTTAWWGLLGLALKGGIWGLLGGAVLGLGLEVPRAGRRAAWIALPLIPIGTWIGWQWINHPKLIYFSHPTDKPREEVWAGLLLGALFFLAILAWRGIVRLPLTFALAGLVGGFVGFGGGGLFLSIGRNLNPPLPWVEWWKLMEFTFGFCLGAALGWAAWRLRAQLGSAPDWDLPCLPAAASLVASAVLVMAALRIEALEPVRFTYTVIGTVVLMAVLYSCDLAWHAAVTLTCAAFFYDLGESAVERSVMAVPAALTLAAMASIAVWWLVHRLITPEGDVQRALGLLGGTAMAVLYAKHCMALPMDREAWISRGLVMLIFTGMAVALFALLRRGWRDTTPASSADRLQS